MKASVLFEQGKPLSIEELEPEPPRAGEVAVRMAASGVCHSCLHAADGSSILIGFCVAGTKNSAGILDDDVRADDVGFVAPGSVPWATCRRCERGSRLLARTLPRNYPGSCSQREPKKPKASYIKSANRRAVVCSALAPVSI